MQIKIANADTSPLVRPAKAAPQAESAATVETSVAESGPVDSKEAPVGVLSGDSGQRIGHFIRGVTHESLQHVRYLAGASAFRNVGSTLGSIAFTPLAIKLASDNAAVVGGVAIGGTVAAGALGGLLGYLWVKNRDENDTGESQGKTSYWGKAADVALDVGAGLKALPNFIYPTVYGATDAQRDAIYAQLDKLPLEDATAAGSMTVIPGLTDTGISGMAQPGASHVRVLFDQAYIDDPNRIQHLVFHENGHAVDYSGGFGLLGANNWRGNFGKGPFISDYASSNRYEDWAEMYEHYHSSCSAGCTGCAVCSQFQDKFAVVERVSAQDPLHRMVDQPKIREAGREIGSTMSKIPYSRDALEVAASLIAPVQMYRGAGDLIKGLENDNEAQKLKGKLNLASGLFLTLPGAGPLALASSLAGGIIKTSADGSSEAGLKAANRMADAVLATSAGPVGMVVAAVNKELQNNGLRYDDSFGFTGQGWKAAEATKSSLLKGTLFTVGGVVGGSLAGAALGVAFGGHGGAAIGSLWGQLAGGAIGLGTYGVTRALKQDKKSKHPLALTKNDKKFLAGLAGGALVGGGAGTALGLYGGRAFGELVGGLVAGPTGASVGSTVLGWGGALLGAYGGAKVGAGIGTGRLLGKNTFTEDEIPKTLARPEVLLAEVQAQKDAENAAKS